VYRNEPESLARLFQRASAAMKAVDPRIRVGGPGFAHPWHPNITPFLRVAGADLDFVTVQLYATGKRATSTDAVLATARSFGSSTAYLARKIARHRSSPFELFVSHHAITWDAPDPRMTNEVAAVFDALATLSLARSPAAGAAAWCDADGWFGKLDGAGRPRPAARLFTLLNQKLVGPAVETSAPITDAPSDVVAAGVLGPEGPAFLLVNPTDRPSHVRVQIVGARHDRWRVHRPNLPAAPDELMDAAALGGEGVSLGGYETVLLGGERRP
jgi:hypothetical protein